MASLVRLHWHLLSPYLSPPAPSPVASTTISFFFNLCAATFPVHTPTGDRLFDNSMQDADIFPALPNPFSHRLSSFQPFHLLLREKWGMSHKCLNSA